MKKTLKSKTEKSVSHTMTHAQLPITDIAIVYRYNSEQAVEMAKKSVQWLKKRNIKVWTAPDQKLLPGSQLIKSKKDVQKLSLVLVLGGDGTYLRAVRFLNEQQIPVLGFNMGSLGFLTSSTSEQLFDVLDKALSQEMKVAPRSLLKAEVRRRGKVRAESLALNDLVFERGSFSQLINISVAVDKFLVSQVKADGIIIATPTGSTAYNLAAGGPLLDPDVEALVMTPVAPHSLTSRPLIFPLHKKLCMKLEGAEMKAHFIVDGQMLAELTPDDEVYIFKSEFDHMMLHSSSYNFFHLLREKLKFGDRAAMK